MELSCPSGEVRHPCLVLCFLEQELPSGRPEDACASICIAGLVCGPAPGNGAA